MSAFRRLIALLLVALWLPATQHCGLEAAGVWMLSGESAESCCDHGDDCCADACAAVEDGRYTPHASSLKVSPPALLDWAGAFDLSVIVVPPKENGAGTESQERPQEWTRDWHFVRRAAYPPRAPALTA